MSYHLSLFRIKSFWLPPWGEPDLLNYIFDNGKIFIPDASKRKSNAIYDGSEILDVGILRLLKTRKVTADKPDQWARNLEFSPFPLESFYVSDFWNAVGRAYENRKRFNCSNYLKESYPF